MPVTDDTARRFVADHYGRRAGALHALGAGEWSRAYAFALDGREAVIRFGGYAEDFRKDQVMAAHSCAALPIPAIIDIGTAADGYFAVSERAHGQLLDSLDGAGMRAALPGLLAALDALRDIDVSGTHGYGIWSPDGTGPSPTWAQALLSISQETARVPGWRAALEASPARTRPLRPRLRPAAGTGQAPPGPAARHSRRPAEPQRPGPGLAHHRGHRLGQRPVRRLAV